MVVKKVNEINSYYERCGDVNRKHWYAIKYIHSTPILTEYAFLIILAVILLI